MRGLTVSFDDILAVFHQFSDKVHCEKLEGNEEFDYLVYFEDGTPDSYRYCIKLDDDGDAVYHRFTPGRRATPRLRARPAARFRRLLRKVPHRIPRPQLKKRAPAQRVTRTASGVLLFCGFTERTR